MAEQMEMAHSKTVIGQGIIKSVDLEGKFLVGVAGFEPAAPASRIQVLGVN
jgi:hypothetical protein